MSVRMALTKLATTAAGGAMLAGGAVHVAERPITDAPSYKSIKGPRQARRDPQARRAQATRPAAVASLAAAAAEPHGRRAGLHDRKELPHGAGG